MALGFSIGIKRAHMASRFLPGGPDVDMSREMSFAIAISDMIRGRMKDLECRLYEELATRMLAMEDALRRELIGAATRASTGGYSTTAVAPATEARAVSAQIERRLGGR